ncbi:hypothetical protein B296_00055751 [Ensete ventricosum]|uniref:Uncharacterized protein n=1 Tax=Ensete ventricosum TaxID=4639 RepID=A0A426XUL5_ENSVE|nr:hypothetical protein B296_00055751 [Ensete ventricosum]
MGSFRVMEITLRHAHFCLRCSEHSSPSYPLPTRGSSFHRVRLIARRNLAASVSKSPFPVLCHPTESEIAGEDVLQMFLKDRQLNGDFISKVSDILWSKKNIEFAELETNTLKEDNQYHEEVSYLILLYFFYCGNWQNESEKRKKLNLLKYESLCLVCQLIYLYLNLQAAFSYASGVLFRLLDQCRTCTNSCLYLQLLYNHADNLSIEAIPEIFMQKKIKR